MHIFRDTFSCTTVTRPSLLIVDKERDRQTLLRYNTGIGPTNRQTDGRTDRIGKTISRSSCRHCMLRWDKTVSIEHVLKHVYTKAEQDSVSSSLSRYQSLISVAVINNDGHRNRTLCPQARSQDCQNEEADTSSAKKSCDSPSRNRF